MKNADVYLYGQILMTTSVLVKNGFPKPDGYSEIKAKYRLTGGETGTCATVLNALGCTVRAQGTCLGRTTRDDVLRFYKGSNVDLSLMDYDENFDGLEDFVLIADDVRTCMGVFGSFETDGKKHWSKPTLEQLAGCKVAAVDPYFQGEGERVSSLCVEAGLPYVTIDCAYDSYMSKHAAINAVSNEYLSATYPDVDRRELMKRYTDNSDGLIIFTLGAKEILYAQKGKEIKSFVPYPVQVESTLGAGDTFKAGCTYALLKGMSNDDAVAFASACAGAAIMKFPIPLHPPTLERIAAVQALR